MPASQNPQQRASLPQGLSEEALKEALQVPCIWVESQDLQETRCQEVEREVALLSPFIQREVLRSGRGLSQADPVILPKQVNPDVLNLLLDYCRFHRAPGRSDKERKLFDEKFIRLDTRRLCELTSAADALDMKPLVDLTSRALARMIEGKSAEEIRETFHLPDDLTEEEKLEPVKNATADPRIRLLNRLYAKKRKELAHKKAAELAAEARARKQAQPPSDDRPLEDLLSFIGTEPVSGKSKSKQKKKRSKKKNGVLQAVDSADAQEAEARPSSDPLPASSVDLQEAGQPSNSCWPATSSFTSTFDHTSDTFVADSHLEQPALLASGRQPFSNWSYNGLDGLSARQDKAHGHEALQPAQAQELQQAKLDPMSRSTSEGASEGWLQPNGHAPQECSSNRSASMDKDDAALLADMQGFASALGCDWQVRAPDLRSLGTLPLPGAHITTLTSLANFRPSHAGSPHAPASDDHDSSHASDEGSQQSELNTDDELEAAYDDRQATNLRDSRIAFDTAMSAASEDDRPSFRPHWPDDPTHASHASFDDWASNGLHQNGTSSTLTSHGSFTFTNACHKSLTGFGENSLHQHTSLLPMSWPQQTEPHSQDSTDKLIDVGAVQQLFQKFLQRAGLDQHLEIRATAAMNASSLHQRKRHVAVQNVLPCGSFMKIQLS